MDLTTRCPQCGTTFLASLDQLQLRKGYIRCVTCAHIFDGYEAVVAPDAALDHPPVASPSSDQQPAPATPRPHSVSTIPATPSVVRGRREFTISDNQAASSAESEPSWNVSDAGTRHGVSDDIDDSPEHIIMSPGAAQGRAEPPMSINTDHVRVEPDPMTVNLDQFRVEPSKRPKSTQSWDDAADTAHTSFWESLITVVWAVVILAGVLVFVLQSVYVFRVQLAENVPALRPALERMCTAFNCTVAYSRQPDMIVITQSALQQEPAGSDDDNGSDTVVLQLTMRNVHDGPQEWPTLVLELKDFSGALIARKNLPKSTYLSPEMVDAPFPANSEHKVVLPLMMQGLNVNGYQLTAFFP